MAKTGAQRQAEYRARRAEANDNGESRINMWIDNAAYFAMRRLAARYGVTHQELIERLLKDEDDKVMASMEFDSPEYTEYLACVTR